MLHRDAERKVLRLGLHHRLVADARGAAGLQLDLGEAPVPAVPELVEGGDATL